MKDICKRGHDLNLTRRVKKGNSFCSECRRLRASLYAHREYSKRTLYWKNFKRAEMLKKRYGITKDELYEIYISQNKCCAICEVSIVFLSRNAHTDHNHQTGKVRGILCSPCNTGLGLFRDNPILLEAAKRYLSISEIVALSTAASGAVNT